MQENITVDTTSQPLTDKKLLKSQLKIVLNGTEDCGQRKNYLSEETDQFHFLG